MFCGVRKTTKETPWITSSPLARSPIHSKRETNKNTYSVDATADSTRGESKPLTYANVHTHVHESTRRMPVLLVSAKLHMTAGFRAQLLLVLPSTHMIGTKTYGFGADRRLISNPYKKRLPYH